MELTSGQIAAIRRVMRVMNQEIEPTGLYLTGVVYALLATLDARDERIKELEEALEEIMAGKWTESGDKLGAAFSELRAMQRARNVLRLPHD